MAPRASTLSALEKRVIKAMLAQGMRNQDIQALVNIGRSATINSGRITGIKKDRKLRPASPEEVERFKRIKHSHDLKTGLNPYSDERLYRSREAMKLAVSLFNSPAYYFKTETFSVLVNIAWTYLIHQHRLNQGLSIHRSGGGTMALSYMLEQSDCPLSSGIKNNLRDIKAIRDEVEHNLFGRADEHFHPIYQACCLNYEKTIVSLFGDKLSLAPEISVALQFSKPGIGELATLAQEDIPPRIQSLDANLQSNLSEDEKADLEYRFRVVYTLDSASKGTAHIKFISPESAEGKEITNVLQKTKLADDMYPYKPNAAAREVALKSGKKFTPNDHAKAWKRHNIRKPKGGGNPDDTDRKYCIYHKAHKDFTYSQAWVDLLISELRQATSVAQAPLDAPISDVPEARPEKFKPPREPPSQK